MTASARMLAGLGAAALLALMPAPAWALAHGVLTFDQPTGTASGDQTIPVYLTLTLDADSEALVTDAFGQLISGGPSQQDIIDQGLAIDFSQPYSVGINVAFGCSGTFTAGGCPSPTSGPYNFTFNYDSPSFISVANLDVQPGQSTSPVLFGTFTPNGGAAPGGQYDFSYASISAQIYQPAGGSHAEEDTVYGFDLATTCPSDGSGCSFTREVTPVPEPGEWAMIAAGLGLVGAAARRRRA